MVPSDLDQEEFLARVVAGDSRHPRVEVLYENDDYGRSLRGRLAEELAVRDIQPVYDAPASVVDAITDIPDIAQAVVRARPNPIVWIGPQGEPRHLLAVVARSVSHVRVVASAPF